MELYQSHPYLALDFDQNLKLSFGFGFKTNIPLSDPDESCIIPLMIVDLFREWSLFTAGGAVEKGGA